MTRNTKWFDGLKWAEEQFQKNCDAVAIRRTADFMKSVDQPSSEFAQGISDYMNHRRRLLSSPDSTNVLTHHAA